MIKENINDDLQNNHPTDTRRAFLRKNALHDIQVRTSKFIPRATSPQMRQINMGLIVRLFVILLNLESIVTD